MPNPEVNELFRFSEVAFSVAENIGQPNAQGLIKAKRMLNRAMLRIATKPGKKWSFMTARGSFDTVDEQEEYSLPEDVEDVIGRPWIVGDNAGRLERIPDSQMSRLEPDTESVSGTPSMFGYRGVDSSGCIVMSLYPLPPDDIEVRFRYRRRIIPIYNDEVNVLAFWGIPQKMIEPLIELATALHYKSVSDKRYPEQIAEASMMIEEVYVYDQENNDTTYRVEEVDVNGSYDEGPRLEPRFG